MRALPLAICTLTLLFSVAPFSRALPTAAAPTQEILLGQSAPLSSSWGEQASAYRDGALLYFDHINAQGGIHGRRLRLVTLDDGYRPPATLQNTRTLIESEKVFALFNYMLTNSVRAAIPLASEAGVPFISPYAGYGELYDIHNRHVFTTRASFSDELGAIVRHLTTVGYTRISTVGYNKSHAAKVLGFDRTTLYRKLERYGIREP